MSRSVEAHRYILPAPQAALWNQLAPAAHLGFVLYGGTAIALRLGHRTSIDFDFFNERRLDQRQLRASMRFLDESAVLQEAPDVLTVLATAGPSDTDRVKVSFFGAIGFGRVGVPEITADEILQVASLDDLMATKLKVILQRVEARDYRNVAAMIGAGVSLARGLASARRLFGSSFQPSECLKALTWFHGGDLDTLTATERAGLIGAAGATRELPPVELLSTSLGK